MIPDAIIYAGGRFANERKYDECTKLWHHALKLTQKTENIMCFPEMFAEMLDGNETVDFKTVVEIFELIAKEIKCVVKLTLGEEKVVDSSRNNCEKKIIACVYLVCIMFMIRKTEKETEDIHRGVYKFIKQNPTLSNGYTPLHTCMCCDRDTYIDYEHTLQDKLDFPTSCYAKHVAPTLIPKIRGIIHLFIWSSVLHTKAMTLTHCLK